MNIPNEYKHLTICFKNAELEAKNYALVLGIGHPNTQQSIKDLIQIGNELKKIEASIGVYRHPRNDYVSKLSSLII